MKGRVTPDGPVALGKLITAGREAFARHEWTLAYSSLLGAQTETDLTPQDLECLAKSAYLLGKDIEGAEILAHAHKRFLEDGDALRAVRCAFWLGFTLLLSGEVAQAGGWLGRAARLLEDREDCVEKGYLLLPDGLRFVQGGDFGKAYELFHKAADIGRRFADIDLTTFGLNGQGRALIRKGDIERGVALLDEAMIAVMADGVSPLVAGSVYCSVIEACSEIFDLRRAQEWTDALDRWCSAQPDQLPYRGHCMLRRAELLQLHGDWSEAAVEAKFACEQLSVLTQKRAAGSAYYQLGELHRLRGEYENAEEAYRLASSLGAAVQPGLAQLRLAQGHAESARAAIGGLISEVKEIRYRASLLDSYVQIALADGDASAAADAAEDLAKIAHDVSAPLLLAVSARASGSVLLTKGDINNALQLLRRSLELFREVDAPYDMARVQFLIAQACQQQGDCDTAELELESARRIFLQLGAAPDLEVVDNFLKRNKRDSKPDLLTKREVEVLRLVAFGKTNRDIAQDLFISEKTVARHLSNIFNKLELSSRAGATAYAFQNRLV